MTHSDTHGAAVVPFTLLGEVPNGAPGSVSARALRASIRDDQVPEVLRAALDVILTATGPRDGTQSSLDVRSFDQAIRVFMPLGHYEGAPNQAISVMDYKMYACRLVHRLLRLVTDRIPALGGAYNSHLAVNARASALYAVLLDVAAERQIPDFVPVGWSTRLEEMRLRDRQRKTEWSEFKDKVDRERLEGSLQDNRQQLQWMLARLERQGAGPDAVRQCHMMHQANEVRFRAEYERGRVASEEQTPLGAATAEEVVRGPVQHTEVGRGANESLHIEALVKAEVARRLRDVAPLRPLPESPAAPVSVQVSGLSARQLDEGARRVFAHIEAHGSVTEAEATAFLGSPRAYRRFALDFELQAQKVRFRVRIESTAEGKRYVKEGER